MQHTDRSSAWFELSNDGWRRMNAGRPLGELIREAVQNAFDAEVGHVQVTVTPETVAIEDDSPAGVVDERLIYTLFFTNKSASPTERGRKGRGLKELLSAGSEALVETVGATLRFDRFGRHTIPNQRRRGTRVEVRRRNREREIDEACRHLELIIPPSGVRLTLNGRSVRRPRVFHRMNDVLLDTVFIRDGVERVASRETSVTLYALRHANEQPHIFEMGLPVQMTDFPWHLDVEQRIPLADGRRHVDETYRLVLLVTAFEHLVGRALPDSNLRDGWVMEVLGRCHVSDLALQHYVARAFPKSAVLRGSRAADDRARQAGVSVIDTRHLGAAVVETLARALPSSDAFVANHLRAHERPLTQLEPYQQRALDCFAYLAERLINRPVTVMAVQRERSPHGTTEDGSYDSRTHTLKVNVLGSANLRDPLAPGSLGFLFHELAHARASEHDARFIRELERIAGRGARLLADEGNAIRERFGLGRNGLR